MLKELYKIMPKTILIIDDDKDFQNAIRTILIKANFNCIQAYSFKQGLAAVSTSKPDLIILDVMMEDISAGFRFMRQFRNQEKQEKKATIPILIVSNFQNITGIILNDQMKTHLRLVDKFIEKPIEPEVLLENINKLIN